MVGQGFGFRVPGWFGGWCLLRYGCREVGERDWYCRRDGFAGLFEEFGVGLLENC
jgi:hypothetical protein